MSSLKVPGNVKVISILTKSLNARTTTNIKLKEYSFFHGFLLLFLNRNLPWYFRFNFVDLLLHSQLQANASLKRPKNDLCWVCIFNVELNVLDLTISCKPLRSKQHLQIRIIVVTYFFYLKNINVSLSPGFLGYLQCLYHAH